MGLKQIRTGNWGNGRRGGVALALVVAATFGTFLVQNQAPVSTTPSGPSPASVALTGLPWQGQDVMAKIREGGPFRYEKDGSVFGNRERLLPGQKRGYYREYTVPTPGLSDRGARRIVCGGERPRVPDACYYTEDHYSSFRLIVQ